MRRLVLQEDMKYWTPDQASDQADQDGWATGTPCREAGVSACRGAGNQGNADRDIGTDQPASAGTWLACVESTDIYDSYGSSSANRLPQGSDLGRDRRFWSVMLSREVVTS